MIKSIYTVFFICINVCIPVYSVDFTGHSEKIMVSVTACDLFAKDAAKASRYLRNDGDLPYLLKELDDSPVLTLSQKDRKFQAIQLVYADQITEPVLAYHIGFGLCIAPRGKSYQEEPWHTNPRILKEYY